eukprot:CCRYP_007040-RA/>CCRYP_007040-RA protein AED:0.41 eAED:0.41 QI:0/0/0/1/1/1/2/0/513
MARLHDWGHLVEHQILDNKASKDYSHAITQEWKVTYQLVPPNVHPWESFNGPLNYDATPLGPIGCPVIIHNKASTWKSWDFRGQDGFSIGPALHQYCCFQVVDSATNCVLISDTVEFRHSYLKQPAITYDNHLLHAINYLSSAIADAPASSLDSQLQAITALCNLFAKWVTTPTASPPAPPTLQRPALPAQVPAEPQSPRVVPTPIPTQPHPPHQPRPSPQPASIPAPPPLVTTQPLNPMPIAQCTHSQRHLPMPNATDAIAHRMRSKLAVLLATLAASSQLVSAFTPTNLATSVLDYDTGLSLDYKQLCTHPKLGLIWRKSYANELCRLCQGIGTVDSGTNQCIQGTDTFYVIDYDDIPFNRCSEITYSKVVCKVCPEKSDPDRTHITIGGNRICYPGDVGTKTAPLELVKLMINSVLSQHNAKFCTFNISNFYLGTPLDRPEYVRIRIDDIPQEFIDKYDLTHHVRDGWVSFQIIKGVYGLPQSGILANNLLETRLNAAGYYQTCHVYSHC